MAELAHDMHEPVFLHLSETEKEVRECEQRHGMTPVRLLHKIGLFDFGGGGFHGVWLDEEERQLLAEQDVSIVTCPCSNIKLASGIADLPALQKAGVRLAIGTDGPASNNVSYRGACESETQRRRGNGCRGSFEDGNVGRS